MMMRTIVSAAAITFLPAAVPYSGLQPDVELERLDVAPAEEYLEQLTVPVTINGAGPYQFAIDTGAGRTMISEELAAELQLQPQGTGTINTIAGASDVPFFFVDQLSSSASESQPFIAPALARSNIGAAGRLGLDQLAQTRVRLDLKGNTVTLLPATRGDVAPKQSSRSTIVVTAERKSGRLIFTEAEIDGVPVRAVVDTGSQVSVGNKALKRELARRARERAEVEVLGVTGDSVPGQLSEVREMTIDDLTLIGGAIAFSDAPLFAELGLDDRPALLLGMATLSIFDSIDLDFANRRVQFTLPPGAIRRPVLSSTY